MGKRLFTFFATSIVSFCFFTFVFHTFVNAEIKESGADQNYEIVSSAIPTPTIFVYLSPTPSPTQVPISIPSPTITEQPEHNPEIMIKIITAPELETLFQKYSSEYSVDIELMKRIAKCESGFNSQADAGLYTGMFQFAAGTWISTRNAMGLDPNPDLRKNAEESIRTTAFMIGQGRQNAWRNCL